MVDPSIRKERLKFKVTKIMVGANAVTVSADGILDILRDLKKKGSISYEVASSLKIRANDTFSNVVNLCSDIRSLNLSEINTFAKPSSEKAKEWSEQYNIIVENCKTFTDKIFQESYLNMIDNLPKYELHTEKGKETFSKLYNDTENIASLGTKAYYFAKDVLQELTKEEE